MNFSDLHMTDYGASLVSIELLMLGGGHRNQDVNVMNETELHKLPDDEVLIHSVDEIETRMDKQRLAGNYGVFDEQLHQIQYEKLANHLFWSTSLAAKLIKLKIGAQVWNLSMQPPIFEVLKLITANFVQRNI
jgi:hypothetical protein